MHKFAIFITCYKDTDVLTVKTLEKCKYNHPYYIIVGDDDPNLDGFKAKFGDKVKVFHKEDVVFDAMLDSNNKQKGIVVYARNYCFKLAEELGLDYFMELDDDYDNFMLMDIRNDMLNHYRYCLYENDNLYKAIESMLDIMDTDDRIIAMAFAQTGDYIGGASSYMMIHGKRKVMNTMTFKVKHQGREFKGALNEDTSYYIDNGKIGNICLNLGNVAINQKTTQIRSAGMADTYNKFGTYYKTFFTVMLNPSAVKVGILNSNTNIMNTRLHHSIDWNKTCPKIISDKYKLK